MPTVTTCCSCPATSPTPRGTTSSTSATDLGVDLGARMMVGLGAYPFATPHTRPSRLSVTRGLGRGGGRRCRYLKNSVDVPAGVQAALEQALRRRAACPRRAVGAGPALRVRRAATRRPAWRCSAASARSPASASTPPCCGHEAERHRARLDELIASNPEHVEVLRQLEQAYDEEDESAAATGPLPFTAGDLPSGDELAAELERFLRDQG